MKKLWQWVLSLFEKPPLTLAQKMLLAHILNTTPRRRL